MDPTSVRNIYIVKQCAFRLVDVDVGQTGAALERMILYFCDTGRYPDFSQSGATFKCTGSFFLLLPTHFIILIPSDCRYTFRNRDAGQAGTIGERIVLYFCNTLRYRNFGETFASTERTFPNFRDTIRNRYAA